MLSVVVCDDVGVSQRTEDIELRRELFALLLRHFDIVDFFATKDLESSVSCFKLKRILRLPGVRT